MHIALDMDDVVLDFVKGVLDTVNRDFDADVRPEDITSWNFGQFIDPIIGRDWWSWLEDHAWLWGEKFKPVPGALGGIEKLRRAGHYVEIITSKPEWGEDACWDWLAKYKPRVHRLNIVPVIDGVAPKKSEATPARVLVDDRYENVVEFAGKGRAAILYNRPHNAEYTELPGGVERAANWQDVLELLGVKEEMLELLGVKEEA